MSTVTPSRPSLPAPAAPRARRASIGGAKSIDPFRVLRRHVALIIGATAIGVAFGAAGFVLLNRYAPKYPAEVLFEIRGGLEAGGDISVDPITTEEMVARLASTEMYLLTARETIKAAVKEPDVRGTEWFKNGFIETDGTRRIEKTDEAVDELVDDIKATLVKGTNLFSLKWATGHQGDVHVVTNELAKSFMNKRKMLDASYYNDNLSLFTGQLTQLNRDIDDLGADIEDFIREKGITTLDDPRYNQIALAMEEIVKSLAEAQATLNYSRSTYDQTAAKLQGVVSPTEEDRRLAEQDPVVGSHALAILATKTSLTELRNLYKDPNHYLIVKKDRELRALEAEYETKLDEIMKANLEAMLRELGSGIESTLKMLEDLEISYTEKDTDLRTLAADMSRYLALEERRKHLESQRDSMLELINEVKLMQLRSDAARVAIAQFAIEPREKSFPRVELIVPLGVILVVAPVVGLIFLREINDQRIKSAADLEVLPDARVLGVIPELSEDPCKAERAELVIRKCPNSVLAESYRQAGALIDKGMQRAGHQSLLLVGGMPSSGSTTVATNLAAAAAAAGRRVVVVDGNFRRPRLAEAMGVSSSEAGLGDLITEAATLDQATQTSEYGIDVIGAGTPANRIFERLNNGQFDTVMAELRNRYDMILIDAPPAVVAGDSLVLANKVDAAVIVVRANQEQRGLVARVLNQLTDAHAEVLGLILNRPRGTAGGYFKKNFATMARYTSQSGK